MSESNGNTDIQWALDLLTPDPNYVPNYFEERKYGIIFCGGGILYGFFRNYVLKRPLLSSIHRHAIYAIIGLGIAQVVKKIDIETAAKRDAMMRDYIIRHPEHFPAPVRRKFSEVFEPWRPIR